MSKRIPKYLDENSLRKVLCPKCNGETKVFFYSGVPEVLVCKACRVGWGLDTEVRYKTERMSKKEAEEYMECSR